MPEVHHCNREGRRFRIRRAGWIGEHADGVRLVTVDSSRTTDDTEVSGAAPPEKVSFFGVAVRVQLLARLVDEVPQGHGIAEGTRDTVEDSGDVVRDHLRLRVRTVRG